MNKMKLQKWINVFALAAVIVVNALANLLPIGGNTTGEVSAAYPTLFTPAPITFFIWAAIYLLMVIFAIHQLGIVSNRSRGPIMRSKVGPWFFISCVLNIAWILAWHTRLTGLALIFIGGMLFCLLMINRNISLQEARTLLGRLSVLGFQIYLGWLAAATIANAGVFFAQIQWLGFGLSAEFWTVAALLAGMVVGVILAQAWEAPFATIAILWAYTGILIRHISPDGFQMSHPLVIVAIVLSMVVMLSVLIAQQLIKRQERLADYQLMNNTALSEGAKR